MKKVIAALVILMVSAGGAWLYMRQLPQAQGATPEQLAFWEELTRECGEDPVYFTNYHALGLYKGDVVPLLLTGLQHSNPVVRWYAAYQSLEYMGTVHAPLFAEALYKLNDDPIEQVRLVVRYAISFIDGNYKYHSWIKTAPDYKTQVYHRYHAAQYNDGQIWKVQNGKSTLLQEVEGSIYNILFSPDSQLLAVNYGGHNWGALSLIDVQSKVVTDVLPWSWLEKQGIMVFGMHPRPDPYVVFREWSDDAQEILLYYAYHTPEYERMYGHAVYNVAQGEIVRGTLPEIQADVILIDKTALGWK